MHQHDSGRDRIRVERLGLAGCELLGALGMVLHRLVHVAMYLTPLATAGFSVIMVAAIASHARLREPVKAAATGMILLIALMVVVGWIG